jgi:hypothetical protein
MSIEEREFADHMNVLLSDVLVSSSRMADLFFSDTDEILALIERGSLEEDD